MSLFRGPIFPCCFAAALGWSYDLFTANLSAGYDSFAYRGRSEMPIEGLFADKVAVSGRFYRWTTTLRLGLRF